MPGTLFTPLHAQIDRRCRRIALTILAMAFILLLTSIGLQSVHAETSRREGLPQAGFTSDKTMLVDPTRNLRLDDVLSESNQAKFAHLADNGLNLGYTTKAGWLKFVIRSDISQSVLLSLTPNFVDLIDVYIATDRPGLRSDDFKHLEMGDHRPLPTDFFSSLANVVPLALKAGETTLVYIRAAGVNNALTLTAELYPQTDHTFRTTVSGLAFGSWFGGMTVLLMIQAVILYFDRRTSYLLLALQTLVAMINYLGTLGLSRVFLYPDGGTGNDIFSAGTTWLGLTAGAAATASVLEMASDAPWLNRLFRLIAAIGVVGIICAWAGVNIAFAPIGNAASVLAATLAAIQALRSANSGGAGTRLRAGAYVILWLGVFATFTQRTGVISLPNWVAQTYAVSCLIQTVLLTGAIGFRLRAAETLNRSMQNELLVAAKAAEHQANVLVMERTAELRQAKQTAEEALRAELASQEQQIRFMEVLGHQYRTPLAAIRSYVDAIAVSLGKKDKANLHRLERVRMGVARLVEVLEVNVARSRLQGPSFQPTPEKVSISELILATAARGRDLLQRDIRVEFEPGIEKVEIFADADMMGLAIINLLENASKFSFGNDAEIELKCLRAGPDIVLSVSDRGIGIPPADLDTILTRFTRGSNVAGVPGTGMGLSLVSRIAGAHRGSVAIDSVLNVGTTVRITIPIDQPA